VRTNESHENIVALSDIRQERLRALSPYGPVKAGLTTLPTTNEVRLMELLNSLENVVHELTYKSFTAYDILNTAIQGVRAALSDTAIEEDGTDADWS
jgi:hypothetical protein